MPDIGKSLVFYLRYFPEMLRLYGAGEGRVAAIDELSRRPDIRRRIGTVGDAAYNEAGALIESCTKDWLSRIEASKVARISRSRGRYKNENWQVLFNLAPPRSRKIPPSARCQIGIVLDQDGITPWAWARGGVAIEEKIRGLFPKGVKVFGSREGEAWYGGAVFLKPIPIQWKKAKNFVVEGGPIVQQVQRSLGLMGPRFITKLLKLQYE